ncbi:MAG: hypothetical protein JNL32_06315 [Candidatus Kapabacteria bacterium]|nr:hypothetical protein [Candidatus Kapabacteria bacterium]
MAKYPRLYLETDIIALYLLDDAGHTPLRNLLRTHTCYTGFPQIAELLQTCKTDDETKEVMSILSALRPLGFHPRYSVSLARYLALVDEPETGISIKDRYRVAMSATIAMESSLPIATRRYESIYSRLEIPLAIIG